MCKGTEKWSKWDRGRYKERKSVWERERERDGRRVKKDEIFSEEN